ncbi:methyltransferase domain-containing protein [Clostridium sp. VAP41]|uniref:class I SAM-dependent methyltransferase n=1 Tax=Clostridium sp. VAP41 TaxID=2949979 RepID=UPI00207A57CC|nr:methyltransferase domain-containing protein [Clostridium sp. VAP41]
MNLTSIRASMINYRAKKGSDEVIKKLEIKKGDIIGDIGSGGGLFTFKFSKVVGSDGKVFAVDTNQKLLAHINELMKHNQIQNIETLLSNENCCPLPGTSCDFIFMRNVFHHIINQVNYFENIKNCLNASGKIVIIEWLPGAALVGHCTKEMKIKKIMEEAGFKHLKSFDFLNKQSFNIFEN